MDIPLGGQSILSYTAVRSAPAACAAPKAPTPRDAGVRTAGNGTAATAAATPAVSLRAVQLARSGTTAHLYTCTLRAPRCAERDCGAAQALQVAAAHTGAPYNAATPSSWLSAFAWISMARWMADLLPSVLASASAVASCAFNFASGFSLMRRGRSASLQQRARKPHRGASQRPDRQFYRCSGTRAPQAP